MDHSSRQHKLIYRQSNGQDSKGKYLKENNPSTNLRSKFNGQKFHMKRKSGRGSQACNKEILPKKSRLESLSSIKSLGIGREAINEIQDGLQLWIRFQEARAIATEAAVLKFKGLHSLSKKQQEENAYVGVLLFTDIESLEAAKISLEKNRLVDEVDYMGVRSNTSKATCERKNFKFLLQFNYIADEDTIRNIHEDISSVKCLHQDESTRQSCFVIEFQPSRSTQNLIEQLEESIGHNGLREVREYVPLTEQQKVLCTRHLKLIVLRDVPKSATVDDIVSIFPYAIGIRLFRRTFPASKYCHAVLLFHDVALAFRARKKALNLKVHGKRVFAFSFHHSMMRDLPELGEENVSA